jgi:hypothetical protein
MKRNNRRNKNELAKSNKSGTKCGYLLRNIRIVKKKLRKENIYEVKNERFRITEDKK